MHWKALLLTGMFFYFSQVDASPNAVLASTPLDKNSGEKKAWLAQMQQQLPSLLCQEDQYFVQCFDTTVQECIRFTQVAVEACATNVSASLPPTLTLQQGEYWGQIMGRCSYDLYEKFMETKKRDLAQCHAKPIKKTP